VLPRFWRRNRSRSASATHDAALLDSIDSQRLARSEQRWQSAHDVKMQLQAISEMAAGRYSVPVSDARPAEKSASHRPWHYRMAACSGGLAAGVHYYSRVADELHTTRAEIDLPEDGNALGTNGGVVISPDGHSWRFRPKPPMAPFCGFETLKQVKASPLQARRMRPSLLVAGQQHGRIFCRR